MEKRCSDCGRTDVEFHQNQVRCKACNYARVKAWRKENRTAASAARLRYKHRVEARERGLEEEQVSKRTFRGYRLKEIEHPLAGRCGANALEDQKTQWYEAGPYGICVSDNDRYDRDDERWRHLSISHRSRIPNYEEVKAARYCFFPAEAEVVQVFPPEAEFVNCHPFCLHLWWSKDRRLVPPQTQSAVGPKL
jgi:ribosomal protein L37E